VYLPPGRPLDLVVPFSDYADPDTPYMFHCHIPRHEDGGMIGQFVVSETGQTAGTPRPPKATNTITDLTATVTRRRRWPHARPRARLEQIEVEDLKGSAVAAAEPGARSAGRTFEELLRVEGCPSETAEVGLVRP
jgi:hypothetical protein